MTHTRSRNTVNGRSRTRGHDSGSLAHALKTYAFLLLATALIALLVLGGCGGSSSAPPPQQGLGVPPPPTTINEYFGSAGDLWTVNLDHSNSLVTGKDLTRNGLGLGPPYGSAAGTFATSGGYLKLALNSVPTFINGDRNLGGLALDIPSRAAIVRFGDLSNPVIPLVSTLTCVQIGGAVTYQYLTLPNSTWNVLTDTAYGTFQASTSGPNWTFSNITQFTLTGAPPATPGSGLPAGFCSQSTTGYSVTAATSNTAVPPVATVTMAFGSSGFFVEDNGSQQGAPAGVVPSNALGAGAGAVGVVQPSSALSTSSVVAGQYLGFFYQPASRTTVASAVSFGCSGSSCPAPPTQTAIVGGTFPNDDPTQPAGQDLVMDLGPQDASNPGLYRNATITVTGTTFPAVAIVGNPEGKFAIWLIAQDTLNNGPLAIYLLQQ